MKLILILSLCVAGVNAYAIFSPCSHIAWRDMCKALFSKENNDISKRIGGLYSYIRDPNNRESGGRRGFTPAVRFGKRQTDTTVDTTSAEQSDAIPADENLNLRKFLKEVKGWKSFSERFNPWAATLTKGLPISAWTGASGGLAHHAAVVNQNRRVGSAFSHRKKFRGHFGG